MIKIREDFKNLIAPLTKEEFLHLEANCIADGIREPIMLYWAGEVVDDEAEEKETIDYIIDGHNRYEIAEKHKLEYQVEWLQFDSDDEVKEWMIKNQFGRRNLTEEQKKYLRGKRYELEKKKHGKVDESQILGLKTHEKLANEFNVSKNTILNDSQFAAGVDLISQAIPGLNNEILQGKADLTFEQIQEIGKLNKLAEKEIKLHSNTINEEKLKKEINEKAISIAKKIVDEIEIEKKNHYAKVAQRIKEKNIIEQSEKNQKLKSFYNVNHNDIYLINNRHKLIVADSFKDINFIKKQLPNIDCILTDPPYGINYKSPSGSGLTIRGNYDIIEGDTIEFEPDILFKYSQNIITWGANHYANKLNNSAGWLVWDKREGKGINLNSDCELAWTNMLNSARLFHHTWNGMIKASEKNEKRIHATQKPIKLFEWCLDIVNAKKNILDLFAGSGTCLIACEYTDRNAFIVESNLEYAAAILSRLELYNYKIEKI